MPFSIDIIQLFFLNCFGRFQECNDLKLHFFTVTDVQKKLENLRTYFGREHGKELEYKTKSGASAKEPFKSAWPWYSSLNWLKDHILCKETTSNLGFEIESVEDESDVSNSSSSSVSTYKAYSRPQKVKAEDKLVKAAEAIVNKIPSFGCMPSHSSPKKARLTDDEHFGQLVARELAKLPESEEKECLKLNIQILIKDAQFKKNNEI